MSISEPCSAAIRLVLPPVPGLSPSAGQGVSYANDMGRYEALATELAAKSMEPMIIEIPPDDGSRTHIRSEHEGEEFVYVLFRAKWSSKWPPMRRA